MIVIIEFENGDLPVYQCITGLSMEDLTKIKTEKNYIVLSNFIILNDDAYKISQIIIK